MFITISNFTDKYKSIVKDLVISILEGEFGHMNIDRPDLHTISEYYQIQNGNLDNKIKVERVSVRG